VQGLFSWWFYIPLAFVGFEPIMFASVASFQTLYQFWIHTKFINKLNPAFEYVFNTPSHHRVHHGVNPQYIDKNHGGTLIIFDRLFGTFEPEQAEVVYGVTKQTNSWNPLWANFEYWIDLFKQVFSARNFSDKMKLLFYAPGWKPASEGGMTLLHDVTPKTFHKYDTDVPGNLNYYVFLHFVLLLIGTTIFLFSYKTFTLPMQMFVTTVIVFSLVNIGGIFESKRWVLPLEFFRLFLVSLTLYITLRNNEYFWWVFAAQSVVLLGSVFWLSRYFDYFTNSAKLKLT
jgi:hypothetical protein